MFMDACKRMKDNGTARSRQKMPQLTTTAHGIAATFQVSLRVLQQTWKSGDSVCQLPLVDVERQTIERIEEFVRMSCEQFLRNCGELKAAETKFQLASRKLIQSHLQLATSIAMTYSKAGLTLPALIRHGIIGLIRAVERFGYRQQGRFATYAACWIRRSIRNALADQEKPSQEPVPSTTAHRDVCAKPPNLPKPEMDQNEH
jgi:DNA-directed RNA polymerase sigma subunit (sigma70/sigma32)